MTLRRGDNARATRPRLACWLAVRDETVWPRTHWGWVCSGDSPSHLRRALTPARFQPRRRPLARGRACVHTFDISEYFGIDYSAQVNLLVEDIYGGGYDAFGLPPKLIASMFAKVRARVLARACARARAWASALRAPRPRVIGCAWLGLRPRLIGCGTAVHQARPIGRAAPWRQSPATPACHS
jgi:hypothetical protein